MARSHSRERDNKPRARHQPVSSHQASSKEQASDTEDASRAAQGSDFSQDTFERHAALLGDSRMSQPMYSQQRAEMMRELQRDYGNSYVQRLVDHISRARVEGIQAKLEVGPAGDKYEQEADHVAKEVVSTLASSQREAAEDDDLMTQSLSQREAVEDDELAAQLAHQREAVEDDELAAQALLQRAEPEEDELMMQAAPQAEVTAEGGIVGGDVESAIQGAAGKGQQLPDDVRTSMEGAFGTDFSGVRVHTDSEANSLNTSVSARAFTVGRDIFFRQGEYNPGNSGGREILAHELTHVVQQSQGAVSVAPGRVQRDGEVPLDSLVVKEKDYATIKAGIQAASAKDKADILGNKALLNVLKGKLGWDDFAKCVELLGRQIPDFNALTGNPTVTAATASAWNDSNPAVPGVGTTQHEEGGWVYLNVITGAITTGRMASGGQAAINLSNPPVVADSIVIAKFHTHPNLGPMWVHGPSPADIQVDAAHGVPDIVVATGGPYLSGPAQRLHLAGGQGLPGAGGGVAPQAKVDGSVDEV